MGNRGYQKVDRAVVEGNDQTVTNRAQQPPRINRETAPEAETPEAPWVSRGEQRVGKKSVDSKA